MFTWVFTVKTSLRWGAFGCALLLALAVTACKPEAAENTADRTRLQNEIQALTQDLYRIHLKLDTAASELSKAEAALSNGNTSAADFHTSEAYREVRNADDALLDLGRDLQQAVNLDTKQDP